MRPINSGGHSAYQRFVDSCLHEYYPDFSVFDKKTRNIINRFYGLDLSFVDSRMADRYSHRGTKPHLPSDMFRSILLSIEFGVTSFTSWSSHLKTNRLFAIVSGFQPGNTPGVGTFYDFFSHLWDSENNNISPHVRKKNPSVPRPENKYDKAESVEKISAEELFALYSSCPPSTDDKPYAFLFSLFKEGFLDVSVSKGLIDMDSLSLAGDGSPVYTSARERSHPPDEDAGKPENSNLRYYSQPDCNKGWDSSRGYYYNGYDMYLLTASDSASSLPVFPLLNPASMHDSIGFVHAFMLMKAFIPKANVTKLLLGSAHDNMATYRFCQQEHITPFIDLNLKGAKTFEELGITFSAIDSRPICMAGLKLTMDGTEKKSGRLKYRCPYAWSNIHKCGFCGQCCNTEYRKVIHMATSDNPRFFNIPARSSKAWKKEFSARTSAERDNKQFKIDRKLEGGHHRSSKTWYCRLYMTAMCIHLDSWDTTNILFEESDMIHIA